MPQTSELHLPFGEAELAGLRIQPTIGADAAALLEVLIRAHQPEWMLEIGTSYGYAACTMGLAAREYGGHVTTIELHSELADAARQNVAALGLEADVEVLNANARDAVPLLAGPFGLILQDGGKLDYLPLLEPLITLLEPGGLLITDDILFPVMAIPESARAWQAAMAEYNRALAARRDLHTAFLPIGDGLAISIKL